MEKKPREIDLINPSAAMNIRAQLKLKLNPKRFRYNAMPIGGLAFFVKEYMELHKEITMDDVENPHGFAVPSEMFEYIKKRMIEEGYYIVDQHELKRIRSLQSSYTEDYDDIDENDYFDNDESDEAVDSDVRDYTFQDDFGNDGDDMYDRNGEFKEY